ncbi:MAG TPA: NADH-quinone oxidoreductase subunit NuoG [Burkholderiales bacterium]
MLNVEIDGRPVEIEHGATVMDAAHKLGIYVPHFCYHKKLSIAANCRMCLVEVEKAPKPLPACATPVTDGMKVRTQSPVAKKAQNSVMEFLLINHPLDCPICDQGGECQLQDLAVGYGKSASRYEEEKRVVLSKDVGPLVAAEEMSRCIQCTRCVRFGQEVAGMMELGMIGRGEHAEIVSFVGQSVESELSGNMIDLCPVGALTSKPFRYSARTWELARRKSISPHDGHGSNLVVQVRQNRVMRVLPLENEAVNECWLSDKERFSYEAVNSPDRLTVPMLREADGWRETDWQTALEFAAAGLRAAGADSALLASPHATLEELALAGKLAKALGGGADFRLRQTDFSGDAAREGIPWLGLPIAELDAADRVLVVGSFLRKDQPLVAKRLRQSASRRAQVNVLHCADDDLLMKVTNRVIVAPSALPEALAAVLDGPIGASLKSGKKPLILLGNLAQQHPEAARLHAIAQQLAESLGATLGFLGEAANSVGGYVAGLPVGAPAQALLSTPRKAYLLLGAEPGFDFADPQQTRAALGAAQCVVSLSAFRPRQGDVSHVVLPIAPFTETSGTFVSMEGRVQGFHATVRPLGEARPAWKVLRVLGNLLGIPGFEQDTSEQVRDECLAGREVAGLLSNRTRGGATAPATAAKGLQRIADVPIHFADPLARRAPALQQTRDARAPSASMNAALMGRLGLAPGDRVRIGQGGGSATLAVALDEGLPADCVRVPAAHPDTATLGALFGALTLEAVTTEAVAG